MNKKLAMVIDSAKCIDCKACVAACKQANGVSRGAWRNWIKEAVPPLENGKLGRGHFQPGACMHCDEPICVSACPTGATFKDPADGVVKVNTALCIGCGSCIATCPYGARFRNPELGVADKCDYCAPSRALGLEPACVQACATRARIFGDADDPNDPVAKILAVRKVTRVEPPEHSPKPTQVYLGETKPTDWPRTTALAAPLAMMHVVAGAVRWLGALSLFGVVGVFLKELVLPSGSGPRDPDKTA